MTTTETHQIDEARLEAFVGVFGEVVT